MREGCGIAEPPPRPGWLKNFSRSCDPRPLPLPALQGSRYSVGSPAASRSPAAKPAAPRPPAGRRSSESSKRRSGPARGAMTAEGPVAAEGAAGAARRRDRGGRCRGCHSRSGRPIRAGSAAMPRPTRTPAAPPGPGCGGPWGAGPLSIPPHACKKLHK